MEKKKNIIGLVFDEEVKEIKDMKKPELDKYVKDNDITLPENVTKVEDIKAFLIEAGH